MLRNLKWVNPEWFTDDEFLNSFIEMRLIRCICARADEMRKYEAEVRIGQADAVNHVFDAAGFGLDTDRLNHLVYLWNTFERIVKVRKFFSKGVLDRLMVELMGGEIFVKRHAAKFREDLEWQRKVLSILRARSCDIEVNWYKGRSAHLQLGAVIIKTLGSVMPL